MATPQITPSRGIDRILTGHFRERYGYYAYRPNGTNDWLLIYTIRGSGAFRSGVAGASGGDAIFTGPGDAMLLRPGTPHDYKVETPAGKWELYWAHFHPRPEWVAWLDWPAAMDRVPGVGRLSTGEPAVRRRIEEALAKMNRLAVSPYRLRENFALNALEEALLWLRTQQPRPDAHGHEPRVAQAEEYLCRHLRENVRLDDLADVVGLSVSRLAHLFREQTGLTPQRYYETQRLERARQLLEMTAMPVKQIAGEVGFANPFYFTLRFKRHTGKSPRAYRNSASESRQAAAFRPGVRPGNVSKSS